MVASEKKKTHDGESDDFDLIELKVSFSSES